jgi:hypothetical protein
MVKLSKEKLLPDVDPRCRSHSASVGQLHVVERVDIAHRAEGIAPIHVLQIGSPLAKVFRSIQPTRRRENKRAQKHVTSKFY